MQAHDWITLFAPAIAGLVTAAGVILAAVISGLSAKASAYFTAHGQAAAAQMVASANAVIQPALQTGASVIAGKIGSGQLDYTNRAQIVTEASREVDLVKARVPGMIAAAAPVEGALLASLMGKIDAMVAVALAATAPSSLPAAVQTIAAAQAALASLNVPAAPAPANDTTPSVVTAGTPPAPLIITQ